MYYNTKRNIITRISIFALKYISICNIILNIGIFFFVITHNEI